MYGAQHALISNGGVYTAIWLSISHQVLVYFDSKALRNPPHAHSAKRLAAIKRFVLKIYSYLN
jgi:hypothetical protein